MRTSTALAARLLNVVPSRAAEDVTWDDSWEKNLRPDNITGLYYWFYPWIRSYYNGTMNFRMEVADWSDPEDYDYEDNVPCPKFANSTIELSYDSILAITRSYPDKLSNPIWLMARAWNDGINLTGFPGLNDFSIKLESVRYIPRCTSYERDRRGIMTKLKRRNKEG